MTVLLVIAILVLLSACFGIWGGAKYPWGWGPFAVLVGIYMLIQQLPIGAK